MKKAILTPELLKEIKSKLDFADWDYDFSRNEGDSQKAVEYLQTQQFSLSLLKSYFENYCELCIVNALIDDGYDMVTAFIKESQQALAEGRCSQFRWRPNQFMQKPANSWDIENTCFIINL